MYPNLLKSLSIRGIQHRPQKDLHIPSRAAAIQPLLTMRRKNLAFSQKYRHWTVGQWKKVMWSDESIFQVITSHRVCVRRPSDHSHYNQAYTVKTVQHSDSVMVWGSFSGNKAHGGL
ncbi:Transposable element Tcb2 transposase-like 9 [Homarus americanus]|uniref:Transposable element Tcb2 transposase-like 9 n=1 Tax=Homarus americanus TaxID=6706 RepID=A0A8J5TJ09_HOMAM|nr:Transposable element Tcb2 transposase-like 9 [Homarus americanus]